jgi:hypothetical protein
MDQELAAVLERMSQQIDGLRGEMSQRMDGIRSDLQLLAEGVIETREQFARHEDAMERRLDEVKELISPFFKDFKNRLKFLENRADREAHDIFLMFREKFGKRQA